MVANRVQIAIIQRSFITTRVVVSSVQDLTSDILALTIIPGRMSKVTLSSNSDRRANHWNAVPAKPGDLLNLHDLEQALGNFKSLPTVIAPNSPGKQPHGQRGGE